MTLKKISSSIFIILTFFIINSSFAFTSNCSGSVGYCPNYDGNQQECLKHFQTQGCNGGGTTPCQCVYQNEACYGMGAACKSCPKGQTMSSDGSCTSTKSNAKGIVKKCLSGEIMTGSGCTRPCPMGQIMINGSCVAKKCAQGQQMGNNGQCTDVIKQDIQQKRFNKKCTSGMC